MPDAGSWEYKFQTTEIRNPQSEIEAIKNHKTTIINKAYVCIINHRSIGRKNKEDLV
ncbi:MAG: hypothetical protein JWO03_1097 [Bacteroidetes bacterium]|nr:hypothetical protein [Bacteroidota bacterium]